MSDEGFLSRWSRRKRAAEAGRAVAEPPARPDPPVRPAPKPETRDAPAAVVPSAGPAPAAGVAPLDASRATPPASPPPVGAPQPGPAVTDGADTPAEASFDLASLPSIDSLTAATDIRAFLRKEVPDALRRAALRKAWSLDPAIRDFVGPADYAWDYNAPDGVPGASLDLVGDVREMLAQIFGPDTPAQDAAAAEAAPEPAAAPEPQPLPVAEAAPPEAPVVALAPAPDDPGVPATTPPEPPRRHGSALPS